MCYGGDKIWKHWKSETKFMDYFTKSETFSVQWPFTYAGNKPYLHRKRKSLLITNINHNLGDKCCGGDSFGAQTSFSTLQDKTLQNLQFPKKAPNEEILEYSKK